MRDSIGFDDVHLVSMQRRIRNGFNKYLADYGGGSAAIIWNHNRDFNLVL